MKRDEIHSKFVSDFAAVGKATSVLSTEIDKIEPALGVVLPASYRAFMTRYGTITCPDLLDAVVDQESDLWDIQSFHAATEVIDATKGYVAAGMRDGLIAFATDSMGNMFCFDKKDLSKLRDDAPVWFFDHDFCTDSRIADSFDAWLKSYSSLKE